MTFKPYDYASMVASECVVCHTGSIYSFIPDSWVGMIHGIHNSHNMPDWLVRVQPDDEFEVTYPTYMTQLQRLPRQRDDAGGGQRDAGHGPGLLQLPRVDGELGLRRVRRDVPRGLHRGDELPGLPQGGRRRGDPDEVTDFHNSLETERVGIIWDGVDLSVTEGKKFTWKIDGIVDDGTNLKISWSATYNGAAVDPCNTVIGAGKPLFHLVPAGTVLDGAPSLPAHLRPGR